MFSRIAAARKPDRMLDIVLPACQMAIRIGFSSLVYQDEVTALISLCYGFLLLKVGSLTQCDTRKEWRWFCYVSIVQINGVVGVVV